MTPDQAREIRAFASRDASAVDLAHGRSESHVYVVHVAAGGEIGPHRAGFDQLFLVVQGVGWAAGDDGVRHALAPLEGAFIAKGAIHSKGSDTGMVAVMVQADAFAGPQLPVRTLDE
jgi:quercetin dioxygenase-like cupin family protein